MLFANKGLRLWKGKHVCPAFKVDPGLAKGQEKVFNLYHSLWHEARNRKKRRGRSSPRGTGSSDDKGSRRKRGESGLETIYVGSVWGTSVSVLFRKVHPKLQRTTLWTEKKTFLCTDFNSLISMPGGRDGKDKTGRMEGLNESQKSPGSHILI